MCLPPLTLDDVATVFVPKELPHINDPEMCGFNFISYDTFEKIGATLGISTVSSAARSQPRVWPPAACPSPSTTIRHRAQVSTWSGQSVRTSSMRSNARITTTPI